MHKTRGGQEKHDERLAAMADLEPGAIHAELRVRAKQTALAMAVALLEQDAEMLCGEGIVNLFVLMQYQGEREAVSPPLSFRQPGLES